MIEALKGLLAIESIAEDNGGDLTGKYPFGQGPARALDYALDLCKSFGFRTKNADYRYGFAEIGQGEELIGILAHLDVVPAGSGWTYAPFAGTEANDRLYGRGVQDDKGPAMACIFAMKELLDSGVPLTKRIRIIFGQDEETGNWYDIKAYKEAEELPDYGFTPDGAFPAVYGEKGIMLVELSMPLDESGFESVCGGNAPNMVADHCSAVVRGKTYAATGKSAHASMPWEGENAITKLMSELAAATDAPAFAKAYHALIGDSYCGEFMNCNVRDEASGRLSMNAGLISAEDGVLKLTLDVRYPVTFSGEDLLGRISVAAADYGISVSSPYGMKPVYMDAEGPVVGALLGAYRSVTGDMTPPMVAGGGTYARSMEHIVAFGPSFPGVTDTEHEGNENMTVENLLKLQRIYKAALENLLRMKV
ncbi:Sapep family Mn(2+)-dependent dipeptidase [Ihubacter sp. rT4E-8]|uniref:Sapep family Mn(2+)-dependent dipeptidase n=1 Tax=unclassified Ihubacter TaxID=2633299 RepID=UPI003C7C8136